LETSKKHNNAYLLLHSSHRSSTTQRKLGTVLVTVYLPVKIKATCKDIGARSAENGLFAGDRMDPIKHHANAIAPIPIETQSEVVVLACAEVIEVQMRPSRFHFPASPTGPSGRQKKIREGNVPGELSTVLSEPFEDSVLTR
jgi:hypothetical protein